MSWVAVAIGGASLIGGYLGSEASRDAAETQARSANRANQMQWDMFQQQREDTAAWREAGEGALGDMQNADFQRDFTMADFTADPGYQFRLQEGQKALERSAAARGGLNSGATMKALTGYGQGMASQEYQNAYNRFNADRDRRFNRLASIAGTGQTTMGQLMNAGSNVAGQMGQNMIGAGNAAAAGQIGSANAWNNAIGQTGNAWMNYQMMNRFAPKTGG